MFISFDNSLEDMREKILDGGFFSRVFLLLIYEFLHRTILTFKIILGLVSKAKFVIKQKISEPFFAKSSDSRVR